MSETRIEGRYVCAVLDSVAEVSPVFESRAEEILADAGIESPEPSETYDTGAFASALSSMVEAAGETTVTRAGEEMVDRNEEITSRTDFESGFATLREQHAAVHRSFDPDRAGQYRRERVGERRHRVAAFGEHTYPEPLVRGAVEGVVEVTESPPVVEFESTRPADDEAFAFVVTW
ncbi:hypothetical protein RYH80_00365 [Halobaculum sp. MBLA0147]|uniref:hypothetical protein n=1 Tax=Halobaculum sp. MBLA0147 TaxID=3079934 RepID=UPI003523AEB2